MKIELHEITVRELAEGYKDCQEEGVFGYGGRLNIRPPYQREFVYKDKQRDAVIATVRDNFPLNVMYWAVRGDGTFEVIDGQQRTISHSAVSLVFFQKLVRIPFMTFYMACSRQDGKENRKRQSTTAIRKTE